MIPHFFNDGNKNFFEILILFGLIISLTNYLRLNGFPCFNIKIYIQ